MKIYGYTLDNIPQVSTSVPMLRPKRIIPFSLIEEWVWFSRMVYIEHSTEIGALITLNNGVWGFGVPKQEAKSVHVDWKSVEGITGVVGTIHSHCNFRGSFSGTDIDDNKKASGIHIVIGDLLGTPTCDTTLTVNKLLQYANLKLEDFVIDFDMNRLICPAWIKSGMLSCVSFSNYQSQGQVGFQSWKPVEKYNPSQKSPNYWRRD